MRLAMVVSSGLLGSFAAGTALAGGPDPAGAEALFRDGRRAADAGDYPVACARFEESERLDPAPGTLLNLADCEENRGQLARAWEHFRQLYDQLPVSDERRGIADARARALEPRAPRLRVLLTSSVPATVTRDDVVLGKSSLGVRLPVDPGPHSVVVSSPGRKDRRYSVVLAERQELELPVSPGEPLPGQAYAQPAAAPPASPTQAETPAPPAAAGNGLAPESNPRGTATLVLGGVGAASLAAGATFGVLALSQLGSSNASCAGGVCSNQGAINEFHSAQSFALAADIGLGVGLACVGSAVVLALTGHHGAAAPVTGITAWSPLSVRGQF